MKTIFTILIAFVFALNANAQFSATTKQVAQHDSTTTLTYTDNDNVVHALYIGGKGSLYYPTISKNGNWYRKYLKKETYETRPEYLAVLKEKGL